jgi:hypothetical protein
MGFFQRTLSTMLFLWPLLEFKIVDWKTLFMDFLYVRVLKKWPNIQLKFVMCQRYKKNETKTTSLHILIGHVYTA